MKNTVFHKLPIAAPNGLLILTAALCAVLCPRADAAGTAYSLSTLTSAESWANPAIWTPSTSTAGPGNTAEDNGDLAILPLGTLTAAWNMSLNSSPTIAGLSVTNAGAFGVTLNPGTPATSTLTLYGATPAFTNNVLSGQTLTIAAPFSFYTANTLFTNNGTGNLTLSAPTNGFFANLNPAGGLGSATTLTLNNVYTNLPPLTQLKTGAGQLSLALVGAATNSFFTNQNGGSLGGNGNLYISGVSQFSSAAGTAQVLTNNSTSTLELDLDGTTPSAFLGSSSFGGIGSVSGKTGVTGIRYIRGTNTLASNLHIDTSAAGSGLVLNLYGYGGSAASTVINGGTWNVAGNLYIVGGATLNIDANMGGFTNGSTLTAGSGNGQQDYVSGNSTINFNPGSTLPVSLNSVLLNSQGGSVGIFNMMSGTVTNKGSFQLGGTGHNNDNSTSYLNITNGVLGITNSGGLTMSPVTTAPASGVGPKEYSFLTISNTGVLDIVPPAAIKAGSVTQSDANGPIYSESTISLGGGTLQLGTPIARQPLSTGGNNGATTCWVQFYFNGGTLQVTTNLPQVFTGFGTVNSTADAVYVASGGAVITNGGWNVGISNNLLAASSGSGGLTYLGTGTLTLSGANTYTGNTAVNAGRLVTTTASTGGGSYSVADGATNQVVVASSGTTLNVSSLTLGTSIGATLEFNNAGFANPSAPIVAVGNPLTLNSPIVVNIYGTNFSAANPVTLMTYPSETVTGPGFILGSLPLGINATLNDTGTELDLNIASANNSLTWNGNVGSVWDINDSLNDNWLGQPAAVPTDYVESGSAGLPVTFDDTATGTTNITLALGVTVHPVSVTINNSALNYSITGAGSIGSAIPLVKNGTGVLTLGVANSFTSAAINGGTLGLTNGNNVLAVADTVTFNTNGGLNLGGNSQTLANLSLAGLTNGTAAISSGNLTITASTGLNLSPNTAATAATIEDLSGLNTFAFNQSGQAFTFYGELGANSTLKLAATNTITASAINLATGGLSAEANNTAAIWLGQSNAINTAAVNLGGYHNAGSSIAFNPGLTSPTLALRGTAGGVTSIGSITIGNNNNGTFPASTIDTTGGSIDAIVNSLYVVNNNSGGGGAATATMSMSNGTFNAGAIYLNNIFGTPTAATTAFFNQRAGTVLAGTLGFNNTDTNGTPTFTSTYNLGYGTGAAGLLSAKTITIVGGTTPPNVASRATLNFTNGTIENYDPALGQPGSTGAATGSYTTKTNLTISGLAGGGAGNNYQTLNLALASIGTHNFYAESGYSITEQSTALISGSGGLTANGPGLLTLAGTNTYTGNTIISAGRLALSGSGSISNTPLISVAGGAVFDVSGLVNPFTLQTSQTLSNNASATGTLVGSLNAGTGTNSVSFTAGTPAFTVTNGTLTLPSTSTFIVNNTGPALAAGSHLLISTNTGGLVAGALTNVTVNGNGYAASSIAFLSVSNSQLYLVVQSTNTAPPVLNYTSTVVGSSLQLTFTWSGNDILESQTNSLTNGYSATGWYPYPNVSNPVNVTVDPNQGSVFFRLAP